MEIIELSDDEPSPQPKRRQGPSQKLESGEGGALRGGEASRVGIILDKDEPGVRITIDLCEDEDGDGDEGSSVIDLTGDDNATLVRKLQRQLNAGTSATVDLASPCTQPVKRAAPRSKRTPTRQRSRWRKTTSCTRSGASSRPSCRARRTGRACLGHVGQPSVAARRPAVRALCRRVGAGAVQTHAHGLPRHRQGECRRHYLQRDGLDPNWRSGQAMGPGEYFGEQATTSLTYCKVGRKMLVFLVLLDPSGVTATGQGVTVIHKPEFQLPIAVVTFEPPLGAGAPPSSGPHVGFLPGLCRCQPLHGSSQPLPRSRPRAQWRRAHSAPAAAPPTQWPVIAINHTQPGPGTRSSAGLLSAKMLCEAPTFMEWFTMVVPTYPEGGSHALQVCQHHHQVVRVGRFVGLSETQRTRCSRLLGPIRLKPSR